MQDSGLDQLSAMSFDDIVSFEQFFTKFQKTNDVILAFEKELSEHNKEIAKLIKEEHELALREIEYHIGKEKDETKRKSDALALEELKQLEALHKAYLEMNDLTEDKVSYDQDDIPFRIQIKNKSAKHLFYRVYLSSDKQSIDKLTLFNKKESSERLLSKSEVKDLLFDVQSMNSKAPSADDVTSGGGAEQFKFMTSLFFPLFKYYHELN